jgi:hypothetical protein
MRNQTIGPIAFVLLLAGCGDSDPDYAEVEVERLAPDYAGGGDAPENKFGFSEAMEQGPFDPNASVEMAAASAAASAGSASRAQPTVPSTAPGDSAQIAYSYSYGFRVDADSVEGLQQTHAALCEKMGPSRCRVLDMSRAGSDDYAYGNLELRVAANEARGFGSALDDAAEKAGGERASFGLSGEDLTETIIDTEAHLASRRLLRDRLMEVLRTRQGSVGDLVAAERAVAEVNEELDASASKLAELRNRVRMSAVSIEYGPNVAATSGGFLRPIADAVGSIGTTLGISIAAIIYIVVALIPVIPFILLLRWLWRRSGFRIRREKKAHAE